MASLSGEETKVFSSQEVQQLYPKELALQYVQIFFRHGRQFRD
jgi:hypothetical protein